MSPGELQDYIWSDQFIASVGADREELFEVFLDEELE